MTIEEIKIRQMTNQHLLQPADKMTVVHDLMGIQAQFMGNAIHALKIRCKDFDEKSFGDGLVKNWTIRGTMHVFAQDDLSLFLPCTAGKDYKRNEWDALSFWNQRAHWALTPERQSEISHWILSALEKQALTREELKDICRKLGMTEAEETSMFDSWGGGIRQLCERGFIHYAVQENKAFCLTPDFVPMNEKEAALEKARRYFTHFGPATIHDAMYFFHATLGQVKEWIGQLNPECVECDGKVYYYIENPNASYNCEMPRCLFLAGFDQLMLGYEKKESLYLDRANLRKIFNLAGIVMPSLMMDGRIIGKWKRMNTNLSVILFEAIDEHKRKMIRDRAESLWPDELKKIEFTE